MAKPKKFTYVHQYASASIDVYARHEKEASALLRSIVKNASEWHVKKEE